MVAEVTWELYLRTCEVANELDHGRPRMISRIPAKTVLKERMFCPFRKNRISFIPFILLSGVEWTE